MLWATYLVLVKHELEPEEFFVVMGCLAVIGESLRRLGKVNNVLEKSGAAATPDFETLAVPVERPRQMLGRSDRPKIKLPPLQREIDFENITFSYPAQLNPALVDVNLTVQKGKTSRSSAATAAGRRRWPRCFRDFTIHSRAA